MSSPPKLTDKQKRQLHVLEARLRAASKRGDYPAARRATAEIQTLLRRSGHETRLQRAKNWLFQAALEAGELQTAIAGFEGVRRMTRSSTRVYLEATVLLAICHLRRRSFVDARPLIEEALTREDNITSERKRTQFHLRVIERLEMEWFLAVLADETLPQLDLDDVYERAGQLVRSKTEDQILALLGSGVPQERIPEALRVYDLSRQLLPASERRLLPSPKEKRRQKELGGTIWKAIRRVVWRSLCDPSSDVYKMWFDQGVKRAADYRVVVGAVSASLVGLSLAYVAVAASAAAIIIKMGVEIYCESYRPEGLMIEPHE